MNRDIFSLCYRSVRKITRKLNLAAERLESHEVIVLSSLLASHTPLSRASSLTRLITAISARVASLHGRVCSEKIRTLELVLLLLELANRVVPVVV